MKHLDSRECFSSDEAFANFRALILGDFRSNFFFRSASSINDRYGRAKTVSKIMEERKIKTVIDFSNVNCRCKSDDFGFILAMRIRKILDSPGPYIIQCDAGKKRTGFVCVVLEAFSGTSYNNIVEDYLESYKNNNGIDYVSDSVLVENTVLQRIDSIVRYIAGSDLRVSEIDLKNLAENYLLRNGLSQEELMSLQNVLLK